MQGILPLDQWLCNWLNSLWVIKGGSLGDFSLGNLLLIALSLACTLVCSGIIGYERESRGHSAGLRTHMLVAVGSAIIMIISVYGFNGEIWPNRDPARLAAQVVTGIGFLGAGTIIKTGIDIRGLTTATTLWLAMALGLACGSGNFSLAIIGTIFTIISLIFMKHLENFANRKNPQIIIVVQSEAPVMKYVLEHSERYGIVIRELVTRLIDDGKYLRIKFKCMASNKNNLNAFYEELKVNINPVEFKIEGGN